nr:hypothetical protein [Helicobacter pylori]
MPLTPPPINTQPKHKALKIAFLKFPSMTLLFIQKFKLQSTLFQNLLAIALQDPASAQRV